MRFDLFLFHIHLQITAKSNCQCVPLNITEAEQQQIIQIVLQNAVCMLVAEERAEKQLKCAKIMLKYSRIKQKEHIFAEIGLNKHKLELKLGK